MLFEMCAKLFSNGFGWRVPAAALQRGIGETALLHLRCRKDKPADSG